MTESTRRQVLLGAAAGLAAAGLAGCSRGGGGSTGSDDDVRLQLAWWGNEVRDAQTRDAVDVFVEQHPGIAVDLFPAEFGAYWDRLATQTAGGDMPDVIQMGDGFLAEYGERGALLDLEPYVDTSRFAPGTVDVGRVQGTLMGINIGINTPSLLCNVDVLEEAGIDLPDDTTWTWDDYLEMATAISEATPEGMTGSATPGLEGVLRAWIRQHDGELFLAEGVLGTTVDVLHGYFDLVERFSRSGAMPSAATIIEDQAKPVEEAPLVVGTTALQLWWSNQYGVVQQSTEDRIEMLRMPSVAGREEDLHAWYHPSMLWCASARTSEPDATGALVDWWVNSLDLARICLDERGRPCNEDVLVSIEELLSPEGQRTSQFLTDLEPALGEPQPVPPPGSGDVLGSILERTQSDLYFERIDAGEAAERFFEESSAALSR